MDCLQFINGNHTEGNTFYCQWDGYNDDGIHLYTHKQLPQGHHPLTDFGLDTLVRGVKRVDTIVERDAVIREWRIVKGEDYGWKNINKKGRHGNQALFQKPIRQNTQKQVNDTR